MKKFSRILASCAAVIMGLSVSMTALAAPSVTTQTTTSSSSSTTSTSKVDAVTADGKEVTVSEVSADKVTEAQKATVKIIGSDATVLKVFELNATINGPTDITMDVPEVNPGQNIAVLHQKADGTWESLRVVKVENGKVTATFTSLSPVAIVVKGKLAPKTGVIIATSAIMSLVALFGAAFCFKKYRFN